MLGARRFVTSVEKIREIVRSELDQHRVTFDPNNVRDYIDSFLLESKKSASGNEAQFFSGIVLFN